MTKKFFQGLFVFFVAAVLSVGFVSCKDDDETGFSIVGTWKCEWEDNDPPGYSLLTFNSNGKGSWQDIVYNGREWGPYEAFYFEYVFDQKSTTLKLIFVDGTETWDIEIISPEKVRVQGEIFIKQ